MSGWDGVLGKQVEVCGGGHRKYSVSVIGFHNQVKIASGESRQLHCHYQSKGKGDGNSIMLVNNFLIS